MSFSLIILHLNSDYCCLNLPEMHPFSYCITISVLANNEANDMRVDTLLDALSL